MSSFNTDQQNHFLGALIASAHQQPDGVLKITDQAGAVVAEVRAFDLAKRPQDMPRAMRPKHKLSMRQRAAARRSRREPK